jgi:GTPase involved in cell partitioning and DNA repair
MAYAAIVGEGIMDNIVSGLRKKQVADVEALTKRAVEKGGLLNYFKPFIRAIPLIGRLIKSPAEVETEEQKVNRLTSQLDRLLQRLHGDQNLTPAQQFDIQNQINALERELMALRGIQVGPVQGRQQQDEEQRRRTILELARQLQQQEQPQQPQQPHGAPPHH